MRRGALCISIDVELAWGVWDKSTAAFRRLCEEKERAVVGSLLELFALRDVPVTWAIVGSLLDPSAPTPAYPGSGERAWYAPDVIDAIRRASPRHDVGSHGFAHLYFRHTDRELLRLDLRNARRVHDANGLDFTSFVFPRNEVAHLDLLAEAGVKVFRSVDVGWHTTVGERFGRLPGRAANLVDKMLPIPPAIVRPVIHPSGLVEIPSSMLLLARTGLRRLVHPASVAAKAKLGLRRASQRGGVFHLWFHPSNLYWETSVQLAVLEDIVDAACVLRDRDELEIRTMASYAHA